MLAGDALELVEAVRVHGGEGVTGAVGVHTPDLPHSLAWLGPGGELTFGDIDHATHLRWFTMGEHTSLYTPNIHVDAVDSSNLR